MQVGTKAVAGDLLESARGAAGRSTTQPDSATSTSTSTFTIYAHSILQLGILLARIVAN